MSNDPAASPVLETLLRVAFRRRITAPDMDAGIARLAASADRDASPDAWRTAVVEALAAGYIHDPVRLPAGALQCHWHLELTARGVETVRRSSPTNGDVQ
jgi:hypothetical protein